MEAQPPVSDSAMGTLSEKKSASTAKDSSTAKVSKMHRRSRSGCFTCRLRRKKCDEGHPKCRACRHLGLDCEYKRPQWWSNNDTRRGQKESIKALIKRTKTNEKTLSTQVQYSTAQMASVHEDSLDDFDQSLFDPPFVTTPMAYDSYPPNVYMQQSEFFGQGIPWEVDVKTERHTYINDELARRDSSISTFNTFMPPPPHAMLPSFTGEEWSQYTVTDSRQNTWNSDPGYDFNTLTAPNLMEVPQPQCSIVPLEDCDRHLFDHLLENVLPLAFPVLEAHRPGYFRSDVVLPALESNKAYLHACLVVAATHMKYNAGIVGSMVEDDILRHKHGLIKLVVDTLHEDVNHHETLDALVGLTSLQGVVGSAIDHEKELIPWHQHFQSAGDIVDRYQLTDVLQTVAQSGGQPAFNMTTMSWFDILGASMLCRPPRFANTYRNMLFSKAKCGLEKMMGCDDFVMYLISEIVCLDSLKEKGVINTLDICGHITSLAQTMDTLEPTEPPEFPYSKSGALRPKQLSRNITAIFRKAARVYLCSLVPEWSRHSEATVNLVASVADLMQFIPSGPAGFDRCLVWPLLICGASSIPASPLRRVIAERCDLLGDAAEHGNFGRMIRLLHEVWRQSDDIAISAGVCEATPITAGSPGGSISTPIASASLCSTSAAPAAALTVLPPIMPMTTTTTIPRNKHVHWRDVMKQLDWDFLLI